MSPRAKTGLADLFKLPKKAYFRSHLWILTLRNPGPLPASALRYAASFLNLNKFERAESLNNVLFYEVEEKACKIHSHAKAIYLRDEPIEEKEAEGGGVLNDHFL